MLLYSKAFPVNNQVSARSGGDCLPSETETGLRMSLTVQYRATGTVVVVTLLICTPSYVQLQLWCTLVELTGSHAFQECVGT